MTITDKVLQETERHLRILHTLQVFGKYFQKVDGLDKLAIDTAAHDFLMTETSRASEYEYYKQYYQHKKDGE